MPVTILEGKLFHIRKVEGYKDLWASLVVMPIAASVDGNKLKILLGM